MTARATLPYGSWPSPVSASDVARARIRLGYPTVSGSDVWWQETRPKEGGRIAVMRWSGGAIDEMLPAPWDARTRVHEYGGRSYLVLPAESGHRLVFSHHEDQRLYLLEPGDDKPAPLTPEPALPGGLRYADTVPSPDGSEVWCVCEGHTPDGIRRAIVAIPLDGSAAEDAGAIRELVTGAHFYSGPRPSPDGGHLAWVQWSHPRMPWDGTELRVAALEDGMPVSPRTVKGGLTESALAPLWADDRTLYVVSDWSRWWNVYEIGLRGESPQALYPAEEEFAGPLWELGGMPYAQLGDGRLAVVHGEGEQRLALYDPDTLDLVDVDSPYIDWAAQLSADGTTVVGIAGGPDVPTAVVRLDTATGTVEALRTLLPDPPSADYLPPPRVELLEGPFGRPVHALVYAPANPTAQGPADEYPPYVVFVHDGPTGRAVRDLDLERVYFTSRGIGVMEVDPGGSTGYGRAYRERLRHQLGVVDVEDVVAAAESLVRRGVTTADRIAVRGRGTGGFTALAAATRTGVFRAATSYGGVTDLQAFAEGTHDFESQYTFGLVGPLPGFERAYVERSPLPSVSESSCPILLVHGANDRIVPPDQSTRLAAALAEHEVRHAHLELADDDHTLNRPDTVVAALAAELSLYAQTMNFTPHDTPTLDLG